MKKPKIVINRFKFMPPSHNPYILVEIYSDKFSSKIYDYKTDEEMNKITDEEIIENILKEYN